MRSRQRVSKLLLRHGIVYSGGKAWTELHDRWLRLQRFDSMPTQAAFDDAYETVVLATARRARLDEKITALTADSEFTAMTRRLRCLRDVATLTGFALAVEIGDWQRFTGASIGAYFGLSQRTLLRAEPLAPDRVDPPPHRRHRFIKTPALHRRARRRTRRGPPRRGRPRRVPHPHHPRQRRQRPPRALPSNALPSCSLPDSSRPSTAFTSIIAVDRSIAGLDSAVRAPSPGSSRR